MERLTQDDLETLDDILDELIMRCTIIEDDSESQIVSKYLAERIADMLELRAFLESPVADIIYDSPVPAKIDNALELPDTPSR